MRRRWPPGSRAMRFFNTAGPVNPADHYCIPPLARSDPDEVLLLVRMKKYFVLHAPCQTGKTSALLALRDLLNGQGCRCVYATVETAGTARDDVERAMRAVLGSLASWAKTTLGDGFLDDAWPGILAKSGPDQALGDALMQWAAADPAPLVLLIDEIDTLQGDPLLAVLQQLRGGYARRPAGFPQSVVLASPVGMSFRASRASSWSTMASKRPGICRSKRSSCSFRSASLRFCHPMHRSTSSTNMSGASAMTRCSSQPYRWRIRSKASRSSGRNLPPTEKVSPTSMGPDPDRTYSGNGSSPVSSPTSTRRPSASTFNVFRRGVSLSPDSIRAICRSEISPGPHAPASSARVMYRHSRMDPRRSEITVILLFPWGNDVRR